MQEDEACPPGDQSRAGDHGGIPNADVAPAAGQRARNQTRKQLRGHNDQPGDQELLGPPPELAGIDDRRGNRDRYESETGLETRHQHSAPRAPSGDFIEHTRDGDPEWPQQAGRSDWRLGVRYLRGGAGLMDRQRRVHDDFASQGTRHATVRPTQDGHDCAT